MYFVCISFKIIMNKKLNKYSVSHPKYYII